MMDYKKKPNRIHKSAILFPDIFVGNERGLGVLSFEKV